MAYECKLIECYPGFGPSVVIDGDMEHDPVTNWPTGGGAAAGPSTATVHGGRQSIGVQDGGAGGGYVYQNVTVEAGHRYRIGVWGYATAGDVWRVRIYIAGSVVWTSATHNAVAWEEEVKFYRVPNGVTTIQIRLEAVNANDLIYFDDATVIREFPVPMTEIDLQYNVGAGFSLLNRGVQPSRPERVSLYGGRLQLELVRQEDGKRAIPLRLIIEGSTGQDLIDRVNALEEMLRHAARYRKDGWGGEVFLEFKIDDATHNVWFPVCEGEIDTSRLYEMCGGEPDDMIRDLPVFVTCEPYWESDYTYDLENLLDNPGFEEWNSGISDSQPDCWADYETAGATGRNDPEVDEVLEGCEALRIELLITPAGQYQGVTQNIGARVRADTEYTLLAWVQNEALTNGKVYIFVEGAAAAVRGTAINDGVARADYTLVECQFTPLVADVPGNVHIRVRLEAVGGFCTGFCHIDKMLVMEASNVPTGWMSSSYLTNHYDRDPNQVNFFSVCDIPGETKAEARVAITLADQNTSFYLAKRTGDTPCSFVWELLGVDAQVTADSVAFKDSAKVGDVSVPGGQRIDVSFAGVQAMALRCGWDITNSLASYRGKYSIGVLARATGTTDTIRMQIYAIDEGNVQGRVKTLTCTTGTDWPLMLGWELFSFPIGSHDDNLWGTGNSWRIWLYAEHVSGDGITDTLQIAGVYLIPLDEAFGVYGGTGAVPANDIVYIMDLDGHKGFFSYSPASDTYYSNLGSIGTWPLIEPEIENWFYWIGTDIPNNEVDITDTYSVSVIYRPQGIFLRGTNP